ncbi:5,6-dimethylbenzimidazole synthase [Rhodobacteraceae bacterium W635]|uniref:5,6-dimethylbenzimidazole synthase n=1 Tax=Nioella halotolerans TaxID=2303578 RepID=UPI000E3EE094|nr:5,6-dimethylbenzimidazole synthase [Rhodobacteraceae bacterium W635]
MRAFSRDFQQDLRDLMRWRRDVRRFRTAPVDEALLADALGAFSLAPSVGLSEPWRLVRVDSDASRAAVLANFEAANTDALQGYSGDKAARYASLKLSGMREAPVQLAVFSDEDTTKGAGLGRQTMPEMLRYSVVSALMLFWLAARARGLGVGWVSILDPERLARDLDTPADWRLVAYLCIGWPEDDGDTPELERLGWETREPDLEVLSR